MNLTLYRYYYQLRLKLQANSLMLWALLLSILLHLWLLLIELPYDQYLQTGKITRPPLTVRIKAKSAEKVAIAPKSSLSEKKPNKTDKKVLNKGIVQPKQKAKSVVKPVKVVKPAAKPIKQVTKVAKPQVTPKPVPAPKPAPAPVPQPQSVTSLAPPPLATPEVSSPVVVLQPKSESPAVVENVRGVTITPSLAEKEVVEQAPVVVAKSNQAPEIARPKPVVIEHEPITLPHKPVDSQTVEAVANKPVPQVIEHEPILLPAEAEIAESTVNVPEPITKPEPVVIEHEPIMLPKEPIEESKPAPVVIEHDPIILPPQESNVAKVEPLPEVPPKPEPVIEQLPDDEPTPEPLLEIQAEPEIEVAPLPDYQPEPITAPDTQPTPVVIEHEPVILPVEPEVPSPPEVIPTPEPEPLPEIAPKQEVEPTPLPAFEPAPEVKAEAPPKPVVIEHEPIVLPVEPEALPPIEPQHEVAVEPLPEDESVPLVEPEPELVSKPMTETTESKEELPNPAQEPQPETRQAANKLPVDNHQATPAEMGKITEKNDAPDMMSLLKQKRAARKAAEDAAKMDALIYGERQAKPTQQPEEPSPNTDQYGRTLKTPSGGMFIVSTLRQYEGTFSFSGWYEGPFSVSRPRQYRVETFDGREDIRELMVNRIIEIIREKYDDEFRWKSNRLGVMVTLSAKPEHHEKLLDFLLLEFKPHFDKHLGY